ncbi:MAG: histidinol-phosphate transaminase [Longimicrobiales bacterium]|nr:histidinol-phosphate transaminase [Longimicrobiales bacterium]
MNARPPFPRPDYRSLQRYAPDRRPVGTDLSDNTNLWGTHPGALARVRGADPHALARYPYLYADELRAAAAARLGVGEDQVATGCGSDDVLDSLWRALAESDGVVRYPAPTFAMVEPFCRMNGRVADPVPWSEALADPLRLLAGDPALVYVCRPNNPTGVQPPREWVEALLRATREDGPVVLFDEAYADFAGETLVPKVVEHPRALVTRTLSKAFGLAGMRVGLAVGSAAVVGEIEKSRGPYKVSRLAETAAVAALRDEEGWVAATVAEAVENRERLRGELDGRGLAPLPSRANFLLFPVAEGRAGAFAEALRERDVAVRPFPDCPDVGDALRVTVGPWPLMEAFMAALDGVLGRDPSLARASAEDGGGPRDGGGAGEGR